MGFTAAAAALLATACGGGGGAGSNDSPKPTVTAEQREAVFAGTEAAIAAAPVDDGIAQAAAADRFFATRPEIMAHGVTGDGTAWAEFADGRRYLVILNRLGNLSAVDTPPPNAGHASPVNERARARSSTEQPSGPRARFLFGFGSTDAPPEESDRYQTAAFGLVEAVKHHGYSVDANYPVNKFGLFGELQEWIGLASIPPNDGVILIDAHGTSYETGGKVFSYLITTEQYEYRDKKYKDDLDSGRVIYAKVQMNYGRDDVYGVSPEWVRANVQLAHGTVILLNACHLGKPGSDMAQAFIDRGADAVFGWDNTVNDGNANDTARFLFDRMLGDYSVAPIPTSARAPLDFREVLADARTSINPRTSVPYDTSERFLADTKLTLTTADPGRTPPPSGSLVPIIRSTSIDLDRMTATLSGLFGSSPGEAFESVTAAGGLPAEPVDVRSWAPTSVTVAVSTDTRQLMLRAHGRLSNTVMLDVCNATPAAAPSNRAVALAAPPQCKPPEFTLTLAPSSGTELPTDKSLGLIALFKSTLPKGATVEWTWSHSGVGILAPQPADANPADSVAKFDTGAVEGNATITARAKVTLPANENTPSRTVAAAPATTTLVVKKALTTLTLTSSWMYEVTWGEPYIFFGCGTEANPVGLCRPYEINFYAVIPRVVGAKATSMTLNRPTPDPLNAIAFPSTFSAATGHWIDRGGYWVQGLSSVGGTAGENGVQPGSAIASETARFGPMTVTVNVTP